MDFGKLRHRIFLLKPTGTVKNDLYEEVPAYELYRPGLPLLVVYESADKHGKVFYKTARDGNAALKIVDGRPFAHLLLPEEYAYHAFVRPTTGREYEEAQKLRAETTYIVRMRYVPGITPDMRILYDGRTLFIESALDIDERHRELTIVCYEKGN